MTVYKFINGKLTKTEAVEKVDERLYRLADGSEITGYETEEEATKEESLSRVLNVKLTTIASNIPKKEKERRVEEDIKWIVKHANKKINKELNEWLQNHKS